MEVNGTNYTQSFLNQSQRDMTSVIEMWSRSAILEIVFTHLATVFVLIQNGRVFFVLFRGRRENSKADIFTGIFLMKDCIKITYFCVTLTYMLTTLTFVSLEYGTIQVFISLWFAMVDMSLLSSVTIEKMVYIVYPHKYIFLFEDKKSALNIVGCILLACLVAAAATLNINIMFDTSTYSYRIDVFSTHETNHWMRFALGVYIITNLTIVTICNIRIFKESYSHQRRIANVGNTLECTLKMKLFRTAVSVFAITFLFWITWLLGSIGSYVRNNHLSKVLLFVIMALNPVLNVILFLQSNPRLRNDVISCSWSSDVCRKNVGPLNT